MQTRISPPVVLGLAVFLAALPLSRGLAGQTEREPAPAIPAATTTAVPPNAPAAPFRIADAINKWSAKECQGCHAREWNEWSRSGHAMTLSAQLLSPSHNSEEQLDQTCLKCHSPELGTQTIGSIVQPLNTKGPWRLVGEYAEQANAPAISCLACHRVHSVAPPGLLAGMDFGDESTFYRNQPAPEITNLYVFHPMTQMHAAPQAIAPVLDRGRAVPIAQTRANQLCYTCHATDRAENSLFEPNNAPKGSNGVGTGDDRTPTGPHQGLQCVTCHMPAGSHTFNPMSSCIQCHGTGTRLPPLDYVTKVRTSYTDPSLSMLTGKASPLNIHWLDKTTLQP